MKMVKKGLSNFLKGLKYYLTPFGGILLFFILGLCVAIPVIIGSVQDLLNELSKLLGGLKFNWNAASDSMISSIMKLNWQKDFSGSLNKLSNQEFLTKMILDAVNAAFGKVDYTSIVLGLVDDCVTTIIGAIIVLIVITIFGLIVGFVVTRMMLRHEVASVGKNFGKFMLRAGLDAVAFIGLIMLVTWVLSLSGSWAIYLAIVPIVIIYTFAIIMKSYLVHGLKKVLLKQVLNPIQILWFYLSALIIFAISAVAILLFYLLFGAAVAIVLAIPLAIIVIIVIDINTDTYVLEQIGEEPKPKKPKKVKEKAA